jgi:hypothetical protein
MSLNWSVNPNLSRQLKFSTNVSQENLDGSVIDLQLPSVGLNNQVLSSNGDGTIKWANGGGGGITNPLTQTLYPATTTIDLGKIDAPFRTLYVSNQTINLVNSADPLKSGSISVNDGNLDIKSNLSTANVNLGYLAGVGAGENSTNIGNEAGGTNAGDNVVNLGFQAGKEDCKNNSINIGNGAGIQNSGLNSIHIGTLAGSTILGGINGDNSIAIGESAGQNNIADNSIIINATGLVLDNLVQDAFIVKPVRDLASYTKILGYDISSGEIFSSDEKNTLNPVIIATPQVEKNIETKNDNSNALVVLQPTIGDTELLGGEIRVNNISKVNNAKISSRGFTHTGSYLTSTLTPITNTISLKSDETDQNLPRMIIQSDITGVGIIKTHTNYESYNIFNELPKLVASLNSINLTFPSLDNIDPVISGSYGRLSSQIIDASNSNSQTSSTIEINDEKKAEVRTLITKSALNIKSTSIINSNLSSTNLVFTDSATTDSSYSSTSLQIKNNVNRNLQNAFSILLNDQVDSNIRSFITKTSLDISDNNNRNAQTSSNIEISDEKSPNIKSSITKSSLTITDGSIANSLSNTQLSMIDSLLNRSLLTRTALQLFSPASTTIPTSSLNQTSLVLRTTSLTPEIATLTNNDLILTSPINSCVASFSSSTLVMNDLAITHGTTINKDEFSAIDASQYVSRLNANSLRIFKPTDLVNPATLLDETKLVIIDGNDKTTLDTLKVKVENTLSGQNCQLLSTGLVGSGIDIFPDVGTNISLAVSAGGLIIITGLPTSNVGLPTGALYLHTSGGHTNVCSAP